MRSSCSPSRPVLLRAEHQGFSTVSTSDSLAQQLQSQLKQVGITVTIKDIPADTETQYLYLDKTIPLAIDGTAGRNSPVEMLDVLYSQQGLMNVDGKAFDHRTRP